jgi:hypothetical protein
LPFTLSTKRVASIRNLTLWLNRFCLPNAQTGPFNRASGQPSPKFQSMKEKRESLRDLFPQGSTGRRLFERLQAIAVETLNHERLDDEEMGFE